MLLRLDFSQASVSALVLAKVGNPSRDEPLQTSRQLFKVEDKDQQTLTQILLRPFRSFNLLGQKFHHHSSLEHHEVNGCMQAIFDKPEELLAQGQSIAKRLYSKSTHPNIKSGDLCMAHLEGIRIGEEEVTDAVCIFKSESVTPFLSISTHDGDLHLNTEHGINPEKIDKGCLIVNHFSRKGYYVLTFDRGSAESRFWVRDFLGVIPIPDNALLSKKVAELAVQAVTTDSATGENAEEDSPPWDTNDAARDALDYLGKQPHFSMQEFEENALRSPEAKAKFREGREKLESESGMTIEDGFKVSSKDTSKAKKMMKSLFKLDSGVEIRLKDKALDAPNKVLERGYDEAKKMNFIKVYYNKEKP